MFVIKVVGMTGLLFADVKRVCKKNNRVRECFQSTDRTLSITFSFLNSFQQEPFKII